VDSEFGIKDICLSVPCVVSDSGVTRIIESPLSPEELGLLSNSAGVLRRAVDSI
jgi:L-lactate dehydrogenase